SEQQEQFLQVQISQGQSFSEQFTHLHSVHSQLVQTHFFLSLLILFFLSLQYKVDSET
ncbi:MAG: hypothetical protein ACI976_002725, partial [Aureispira sp.]